MVVGDQSSGKSSLLEGLTGLSFPTDNGLCTRFATQIILRRSEKIQSKVTILPGPSATDDPKRKEALERFKPVIGAEEGLFGPKLSEILDQVSTRRESESCNPVTDLTLGCCRHGPTLQHTKSRRSAGKKVLGRRSFHRAQWTGTSSLECRGCTRTFP